MSRFTIRKVSRKSQYVVLTENASGVNMCLLAASIPELIALLNTYIEAEAL